MSKVIVLLVIGLKENLKEFVSVGKCGKFAGFNSECPATLMKKSFKAQAISFSSVCSTLLYSRHSIDVWDFCFLVMDFKQE
jgi:hypothetical protein